MKIFNNENGKKVVYVQLNDLTQRYSLFTFFDKKKINVH